MKIYWGKKSTVVCEFKRDERNNMAKKLVSPSGGIAAIICIAMRILMRCSLSSLLLFSEVVCARGVTRRWLAHPKPTLGNKEDERISLSFSYCCETGYRKMWVPWWGREREDCSVTCPRILFPGQLNTWGQYLTELLWKVQHNLFFSEEILLCILATHVESNPVYPLIKYVSILAPHSSGTPPIG